MNKQAPDILSDQAQSHLNRTILKLAWPAILEQFLISGISSYSASQNQVNFSIG